MSADPPVLRFAPSPNGYLHLGHAFSALLNRDMARAMGGRLLLRIEDIDIERCRPEFEAAIVADLKWLGFDWEEPLRRQSEHIASYRAALEHLREEGLVYPAFLTRGEIKARVAAHEATGGTWPRDPDGSPLYPGDDRRRSEAERRELIASGIRHAWRLDMAAALARLEQFQQKWEPVLRPELRKNKESEHFRDPDLTGNARGRPLGWRETGDGQTGEITADPSRWGDVVLWRSDAPSSYHLSVTLDDAEQGVTHVVRGLDLFEATAVHRLLQDLLGLAAPVYHHHRLITGPDGRKLSKSAAAPGIRELAASGLLPADILRLAAQP